MPRAYTPEEWEAGRADMIRRTYADYSDPDTGELPDPKSFEEKIVQNMYRYGDLEGLRQWKQLKQERAEVDTDTAEIKTFKRLYPGVDPGSEEGRKQFFKMKERERAKPAGSSGELKGYQLSKIKADVTGELIQQYRKRNPRDKDLVAMNQMLGLEYGQKPSLEQLQDAFAQMGYDDLAQYGDEIYSNAEKSFDSKNPTGSFMRERNKLREQYFGRPTAPAQKKGGLMDQLPDAGKHKGKTILELDAKGKPTGRKLKSDGRSWNEARAGGVNLAMNAEEVPLGTGLADQAKTLFKLRKEMEAAYLQGDFDRAELIKRQIDEIARQRQNVG